MVNEVHEYLLEYGVKPSPQRVAIMQYLKCNSNHPTADHIFTALHPQMPTLSKMTVYNTLKLLADRGAILALNVDERQTRFDGDISAHAHFICQCCGEVGDVRIEDHSFAKANAPQGVVVKDVQLIYKGICIKCLN